MNDFELFDFDYPIEDINWKNEFEKLFKDHYYFYEIGFYSIDRFKHRLKTRLNLIMPRYNELFKTTLFELHPLLSKKYEEVITETNSDSGSQDSTSNITNDNNTISTDYPQHTVIEEDIPTGKTKSEGGSDSSTNSTYDNTQTKDFKKIIEGFEGNQNELLKSYRENIININKMLIEDLKILFLLVY